jgi:hypothetical protein
MGMFSLEADTRVLVVTGIGSKRSSRVASVPMLWVLRTAGHERKGKPVARRGRKATGLTESAGLPMSPRLIGEVKTSSVGQRKKSEALLCLLATKRTNPAARPRDY